MGFMTDVDRSRYRDDVRLMDQRSMCRMSDRSPADAEMNLMSDKSPVDALMNLGVGTDARAVRESVP